MLIRHKFHLAYCLLVLLFLLGLSACSPNDTPETEEEPYIAVEVAPVTRGEINLTAQVGGTVKAGGEVAVVARLGGEVSSVKVSLGDRVEKGDLLVSLDAPDVTLQVRQARDAVNSLREARDEMQDMIDELEERFEEIRNETDDEEPGEDDSDDQAENPGGSENANNNDDDPGNGDNGDNGDNGNNEDNGENGNNDDNGDPPPPDTDEDEDEPEIPQWLRDLMEDGGFTMDPALTLRQQLATLEAQLQQAERGLEMARLGQSNLSVKAPVSGTVTFVNVIEGVSVGPGSPLLMLSSEGGYQVAANVLESLITLIHPGDQVQVDLPIAGETYMGSVTEVAPAPMPNTRIYPVKVTFEPTEAGRVLPGMFARVTFVKEASGETLVIPKSAVLQRAGEDRVYIAEGDRARARPVTLGLQDGDRVQVLSGLEEGDTLVIRGQHYLDEGSRVKIVKEAGAAEGAGN